MGNENASDENRKVEVTENFLVEVILNSAKAHFNVFNAGNVNGCVTKRANTREDVVRDMEDFIAAIGFRNVPNSAYKIEEYKEAEKPDYSMAGFKALPRTFYKASIPIGDLIKAAGFRYV